MSLQDIYKKKVVSDLQKELNIENEFAVPKVAKIVINIGLGEAVKDKKVIDTMSKQMALITGQKPQVTKAKKAIATYKLRAGMPIGLKTTLRGKRMYQFLEKLIAITFPRVRDFRGVRVSAFDKHGNLNLGFTEITVFPEVQYQTLDKMRGFEATIVTTAKDALAGKLLLEKLGMPFEK